MIKTRSRDLSKAEEIWREFQESGRDPDVKIYNAMIKSCVKNNNPERAEELYKDMLQKGEKFPRNFSKFSRYFRKNFLFDYQ